MARQQYTTQPWWQNEQGGFLFYFAIILIFTGLATSVIIRSVTTAHREGQTNTARAYDKHLLLARNTVEGFAHLNFRLPCPDTTGDGIEDCANADENSVVTGSLPWRSLGMREAGFLGHQMPRYAVFSDGNTVGDAAAVVNDVPSTTDLSAGHLAGAILTTTNELCTALDTLRTGSMDDTNYIHTETDGGAIVNEPFFIVQSGLLDMDGDGDLFDGRNTNIDTLNFESSNRLREGLEEFSNYDDWVVHSGTNRTNGGLVELCTRLGCAQCP
ncbi:hypothetical protein [Magnetococcus sp. PR-3]|uniref:hypothetical protein n=1 Tax=Magnetococcus sp. PR-3 TaxID=3120355 RepID=UPI002FCE6208